MKPQGLDINAIGEILAAPARLGAFMPRETRPKMACFPSSEGCGLSSGYWVVYQGQVDDCWWLVGDNLHGGLMITVQYWFMRVNGCLMVV